MATKPKTSDDLGITKPIAASGRMLCGHTNRGRRVDWQTLKWRLGCSTPRRWPGQLLFLALVGIAVPTLAQSIPAPPVRQAVDANGVDLVLGTFNVTTTRLTIGPSGPHGLGITNSYRGGSWRDSLIGTISGVSTHPTVSIGGHSDDFVDTGGGSFVSQQGNGATLRRGGGWFYTAADGTYVYFTEANGISYGSYNAELGYINGIQYPDGTKWSFIYETGLYCSQALDAENSYQCPGQKVSAIRLRSVINNSQYQIKLSYVSNVLRDGNDLQNWQSRSVDTAINNAVEACDPVAQCTLTNPWPNQNARGALQQYSNGYYGISGVRRPTSSSDNIVIGYDGNSHVASVTNEGVAWTYSFSDSGSTRTAIVTGPLGAGETVVSDIPTSLILSSTNSLGFITHYAYDSFGRVIDLGLPSGIHKQYVYDGRGNITSTTTVSNNGSGSITTSAGYNDTACTYPTSCNKPTYTIDARGSQTGYTYDPTTGSVLTVTAPPGSNGVRPQTRYGYTTSNGVALLTSISRCITQASCAGTADESLTTIAYGRNNLPASVTKSAGDNSTVATTTYAYDNLGNVTSVDGPLAGAVDVTYLHHNTYREVIGVVGPDPDGSGPRQRRAQRLTIDADGKVTTTEQGTVTDGSDNAWAAFSPVEAITTAYDANARRISSILSSGGTPFQQVEYSYDGLGRPDCTAQRMNPAHFTTTTAACAGAPAGSFGPDRITRSVYDSKGQVLQSITGYGTGNQRIEAVTYTPNGKTSSTTDANGNLTAFTYDGFNRLAQTTFPSQTQVGQANSGDFESYGYDAAGNRTSFQKRDGRVLTFAYDGLNRTVTKFVPTSCPPAPAGCPPASAMRSVYYGYTLSGQLTYARFDSASGEGVASTYNALGQLTTATTTMSGTSRTLSYQYDAAGNRTQILHPDGIHFDMTYDADDRMTGATWTTPATGIIPFMGLYYDDLGRRTTIGIASGGTNYGYDGISRLTSQYQGFAGGTGNLTETLTLSPADQIVSRVRDNDDYIATSAVAVNRPYAVNGLNQYTTAGPASFIYDADGNLISDGTNSYVYDAENRMVAASANGVALTYDPLGRLWQTASPALGNSQFLSDGDDHTVLEYDGSNGNIRRRFMWGAGVDELIIEDDGGAMNCSATHFLHADHQGSIIAVADCWGNRTNANGYDEYGIPNANNWGRFQYTGQAWLADVGMYYYKARMYSPTLGRFMQTDPIGYGDGLNWHNYAGADPVNNSDPNGLEINPDVKPIDPYYGPPEPSPDAEIVVAANQVSKTGPDNTGLFDSQSSASGSSGEQEIGNNKSDVIVVTARSIKTTSILSQILRPDGAFIGERDKNAGPEIRTISPSELNRIVKTLIKLGASRASSPNNYPGQFYKTPDGGSFGVRFSPETGFTLDVSDSNLPKGFKVHQNDQFGP